MRIVIFFLLAFVSSLTLADDRVFLQYKVEVLDNGASVIKGTLTAESPEKEVVFSNMVPTVDKIIGCAHQVPSMPSNQKIKTGVYFAFKANAWGNESSGIAIFYEYNTLDKKLEDTINNDGCKWIHSSIKSIRGNLVGEAKYGDRKNFATLIDGQNTSKLEFYVTLLKRIDATHPIGTGFVPD